MANKDRNYTFTALPCTCLDQAEAGLSKCRHVYRALHELPWIIHWNLPALASELVHGIYNRVQFASQDSLDKDIDDFGRVFDCEIPGQSKPSPTYLMRWLQARIVGREHHKAREGECVLPGPDGTGFAASESSRSFKAHIEAIEQTFDKAIARWSSGDPQEAPVQEVEAEEVVPRADIGPLIAAAASMMGTSRRPQAEKKADGPATSLLDSYRKMVGQLELDVVSALKLHEKYGGGKYLARYSHLNHRLTRAKKRLDELEKEDGEG